MSDRSFDLSTSRVAVLLVVAHTLLIDSLVVGILLQAIEQVELSRCFWLHVGVAALVKVRRVAPKVPLRCQVQGLPPESVSLAMREHEDVFLACEAMECKFFRHIIIC